MRILFVDDEPMVLSGLGRLLWKQQSRWAMTFVKSGPAALDALEENAFDLVISDLRMSPMDGAVLLRAVKERHPGVARVLLSGQADRDLVVRSLPVAHQYLHKPCSAATLMGVIERIARLRERLGHDGLRTLVGSVDALHVAPALRQAMVDALGRTHINVDEVVDIVERSPVMAAKLLQIANSSFFGLARVVVSVAEAVAAIGVDVLRTLIIAGDLFASAAPAPPAVDALLARARRESVAAASLARSFTGGADVRGVAFAAGLVHEIGRMVTAVHACAHATDVAAIVCQTRRPLHEVETEVVGANHADLGSYLLGLWGLPVEIVEPVAHHHAPRHCPPESARITAALHVADAVLDTERGAPFEVDMSWLDTAGVTADLPRWRQLATHILDEVGTTDRSIAST
jgi:HD-like signal output (HDOD) protein/ActR/RegA family two-component response regulator